jgi:hypothetical protein
VVSAELATKYFSKAKSAIQITCGLCGTDHTIGYPFSFETRGSHWTGMAACFVCCHFSVRSLDCVLKDEQEEAGETPSSSPGV